jgi:hypothetical protein
MSAAARYPTRSKYKPDSKLLTPLVSAVITGITTLGVSFIGIVPQLRSQDRTVIDGYKADIESMQKKLDELTKPLSGSWTFSGNIQPVKGKSTGNDQDKTAEVYLVPEALGSHTDSAGDYSIRNVPRTDYSLLVRLPTEKTITMHVSPDQATRTFTTVDGLSISYARGDEP